MVRVVMECVVYSIPATAPGESTCAPVTEGSYNGTGLNNSTYFGLTVE
jgi:hypothetical protein